MSGDSLFLRALEVVLAQEGGYVNDPDDPGGETNFGISKRAYPTVDIAKLTRDQAAAIYHRDYYAPPRCGDLPPQVAVAYFDACVNHGTEPGTHEIPGAPRLLQRAIRHFHLSLEEDGVVGPATLAAASAIDAKALLGEFLTQRALRYASITTFSRFGAVWMRRLFSVHQASLLWTATS